MSNTYEKRNIEIWDTTDDFEFFKFHTVITVYLHYRFYAFSTNWHYK